MHKATANGGDNKCMNIYEVLKAVGFGNMHPGPLPILLSSAILSLALARLSMVYLTFHLLVGLLPST